MLSPDTKIILARIDKLEEKFLGLAAASDGVTPDPPADDPPADDPPADDPPDVDNPESE